MPFPPLPAYPNAIDSDYTLFLVYNTSESKLVADNSAWAQELSIVPVEAGKPEVWANNGFATISGELFYYDSVAFNSNGKVNKLKGCARSLPGGEHTQFNPKGTWVRGMVVAEHHNQLVDAILATQNFIGFNFDPRHPTLDWRIRNLQALDVIFDDFACPDVNFTFNITQNDPVKGITAEYLVEFTTPATNNSYRLDFGDGQFTTTEFSGTHQYALNARVDPVVTCTNDQCQTIITPVERSNPAEPPPAVNPVFEIPVPEFPNVPDFTFVPCNVPPPDINLPPLVIPCISIEGQIGPIPSVITGPDINMVSNVVIHGPDNPVQILFSSVEITGTNIPSIILIDPPVPPTIIIDPPIPPTIVIVPPASSIVMALDATDMPRLEVDWSNMPQMNFNLTMARQVRKPTLFAADPHLVKEFGTEFADLFEAADTTTVEYETVGIPSEIALIAPDGIKLDMRDMPKIQIDTSDVNIPPVKLVVDGILPTQINLNGDTLPDSIDLVYTGHAIPVRVEPMPALKVEHTIPTTISVEMSRPIPEKLVVEHNIPDRIILEGPASIPLVLPKDIGIPVIFPDKMPEIPLVYNGAPIEVKITMDPIIDKAADGRNCVMITPCPR